MGIMYDVIGEKVLKKGIRLKNAPETPHIQSVKQPKFEKFFKKHASIAEFIPLDFFAAS